MPHLRGLGIREGQWASFPSLPFHPGDRDPSGSRGETVRGPRCGREGVLRGAGQVADPPAAGPRGMWPRRAGPPRSQSAPRPAPSPLPVPPPESPPPRQLREAGTRRRRLLRSPLSRSLGSLAVAAPSEAELQRREPEGQPVGGRTDGRQDRPTESGAARRPSRFKFRHELGHGAVGESGRGDPRADPGARGARAG